tara:strand:- start:898 stop:1041 length:144 start_codon:yes stop_codon:yes gene_type:complete
LPNSLQKSAEAVTQKVPGNLTEAAGQTGDASPGVLNTIKELNYLITL